MLEHKWLAMTRQHNDDGVIAMDASGCIALTNSTGQKYLALLADARVGDVLTHLGGHSLERLLHPPFPAHKVIYHEVVLAGPPRQVFDVEVQPASVDMPVDGWVLVIRATKVAETEAHPQPQQRQIVVAHWPPVSPATSNLP